MYYLMVLTWNGTHFRLRVHSSGTSLEKLAAVCSNLTAQRWLVKADDHELARELIHRFTTFPHRKFKDVLFHGGEGCETLMSSSDSSGGRKAKANLPPSLPPGTLQQLELEGLTPGTPSTTKKSGI